MIAGVKDRTKKSKAVPHRTDRRFSARHQVRSLGRKGLATATALACVWIGNLEATAGKIVAEIHPGAAEIL